MALTINKTNHSDFVPTIWARVALGTLMENAVMARLVYRNWSNEIKSEGDTIQIPKRGSLSVQDKVAGTDVAIQQPTGDKVTLALNKHKVVSFLVEDTAEAESSVDIMSGYMEDAMRALAEQVDTDLLSLYASMSTSVGTGGDGLASTTDSETLLTAMRTFDENQVGSDRVLVTSPLAKTDLLKCNKFVTADKVGTPEAIRTGLIGALYGFNIYHDPRVVTSGVSPTTQHNVAFNPYGLALITRPLPPVPPGKGVSSISASYNGVSIRLVYGYDMRSMGMRINIDLLYGVGIVRQDMVLEVKS